MGWLPLLPLALFAGTYVGLALGRLPGLALDRTGIALLGAVAFLATGLMSLDEAKAAVDGPTMAVLFGLMLLSAQYRVAGLYTAIGRRVAAAASPRRLLAGVIVVTALLSAVLTNDVVCFALTPLIGAALLRTRLDPFPFLVAIACASNIGSACTPIGNPQNILIAQRLGLPFLPFLAACGLPVLVSLAFCYWWCARLIRERTDVTPVAPPDDQGQPFDRLQAAKAIACTAGAIALFLTPVPAYLTALGVAGIVLASRRLRTPQFLGLVDWHLLTLFVGLFVVVRGLELSGWTAAADRALHEAGADVATPALLVPVSAVLSNLVSNVPAVMLLLPFLGDQPATGHGLALASTLAGNAWLLGRIANLIVVVQAERLGIPISARRHLAVGLPVTLVSLAAAAASAPLW